MSTEDPATEREQRFTELFDAHHTAIVAYVRRRLSADLVDDAVAETFIAAWSRLDRLSGEPLIWLYGLARGVVANTRRQRERAGRLSERAAARAPHVVGSDPAELVGWEDEFLAAWAALRESERELLRITTWEGLGPAGGAAMLGCSVAAFKVRLHRARRHLRRLLDANERAKPASMSLIHEWSGSRLPLPAARIVEIDAPLARTAYPGTPKETP